MNDSCNEKGVQVVVARHFPREYLLGISLVLLGNMSKLVPNSERNPKSNSVYLWGHCGGSSDLERPSLVREVHNSNLDRFEFSSYFSDLADTQAAFYVF